MKNAIAVGSMSQLCSQVLDSLETQLCVIDPQGFIVYVNQAWVLFGRRAGIASEFSWIGINYLQTCTRPTDSLTEDIQKSIQGIKQVQNGERDSFTYEYPCDSPSEKRWFLMSVTPLAGWPKGFVVITHSNITQRKQMEMQLEHLALHDPMTGLSNRRHFYMLYEHEWRRCQRQQLPICVVVFDIDHFKNYNDAFGHIQGDECIVRVGRVIDSAAKRGTDFAARFGGEEFILALVDTPLEAAIRIVQNIREQISELGLVQATGELLTLSGGVALCVPASNQKPEILIASADAALYRAKKSGRNQICIADKLDN